MSESKHTPGPWMLGYWGGQCRKPSHQGGHHPGLNGDDPCIYEPEFNEWQHEVAAGDGSVVVGSTYDGSRIDNEADARLIAAAPDLLEALQRIAADAESGQCEEDVLEIARAALSRALGDAGEVPDTLATEER